ncbi:MAG: bifunctional 4-hydroxy-3-methylbut-2-enyl diphosphate reductase/30S ribosomal protein S1 [Eubacterium sp.]|nr:bifunctional 4-hydroxy-3-methylbut-2-enyl diphosphate reductase/30S ribosomal protein S1 [Eubacterium sp.]
MKIIIADKAGYCFGIENAMRMVQDTLEKYQGEPIYCLGDISHNRQEMDRLIAQGVKKIDSVEEAQGGCIIIRSHGVGKSVLEEASARGLKIINATCPFVRAMQKKVADYYAQGYQIIIVGNAEHPEVIGACGWCDDQAIILNDIKSVEKIPKYDRICVVAQTTIIESKFNAITEALKDKADEIVIFNTICSATAERQAAAAETAKVVEYMIVIGGYHSSNTQKLLDICKTYCKNTCHIETAGELNPNEIKKYNVIGITAGASTPDWIVKEVTESMEENKMEQQEVTQEVEAAKVDPADVADADFDFAAEIEESLKPIRKGAPVEGEVIHIDNDEIILNIGYKADAVIKKNDFTWKHDEELTDLVKLGDKITAIVTDLNDGSGSVKLSKIKYDNQKVQRQLAEAYENKTVLEGKVKGVSGSGLIVDIGFTDIFMPASQYHVRYVKDLEALVGEDVKGIIIDYNAKRRRAILSQKVILEKELKEKQAALKEAKEKRFGELEVGDLVKGTVKTITNFGIFVDLNGIDGFVHRSDLTWERANEPKDLVEKGQEIEAKVISKNEEDKKIKLSVKALKERPWEEFIKNYKVNDEVEVKITNVLDFGAFAEIIPGVEGLIHVSEISYERVESVASVLKTGDVVKVKIIGIDTDKEKISLSIKATLEAPARQERPRRSESSYDRPARSEAPRRKPQQAKNKTVYEESANVTLGDAFGALLEGLSFDDDTEE